VLAFLEERLSQVNILIHNLMNRPDNNNYNRVI
jgi:hypothetical protein